MTELREVLLSSLTGLLAIVCAFALYGFFFPPFADAEIQESFIDTWQVNAILTAAALGISVVAGALSALLSWRAKGLSKTLAVAAAALCVISVGLLFFNHAALTSRTTELTGQTFGGAFGLGLGPL